MDPAQNTKQNPGGLDPTPPPVVNPVVQAQVVSPIPQATVLPQSPNPEMVVAKAPKSGFKKLLTVLLVLLFFGLLGGTALGAYAVAYEKIKLDKYPEIQKKISAFVISLPFMPKTPRYLLAKSAYVHQSVTRESFDVSMAIDSKDLASALGLSGLDVEAKGAIDYSDTKNVKVVLNTSVTKDFNIELIKLDKILYFKINKVPQILLTTMGFKSGDFDPLLAKWVSYDITPLETEARKSLGDKEVDPLSQEYVDEEFQKYLDEKVVSKIKVENANEDGFDVYKLTLVADKELIDYIGKKAEEENKTNNGASLNVLGTDAEKLSDVVKSLTLQVNIDKKDYYTRKIVVHSEMEGDSFDTGSLMLGGTTSMPEKANAKIAFVAKFGDFGKELTATKPASSMTSEEFLNLGSDIVTKHYMDMRLQQLEAMKLSPTPSLGN